MLTGPRSRRRIVRWLRRTAAHTAPLHPLALRRETLLTLRLAMVRANLLEMAAMLERAQDPDPARRSPTAQPPNETSNRESPAHAAQPQRHSPPNGEETLKHCP